MSVPGIKILWRPEPGNEAESPRTESKYFGPEEIRCQDD